MVHPRWARLAVLGTKTVEVTTYPLFHTPQAVVLCTAAAHRTSGKVAVAVALFLGPPRDGRGRAMAAREHQVKAMEARTGIPGSAWDDARAGTKGGALPGSFGTALRSGGQFHCCESRVLFRIPKAAAFCVPFTLSSQNPFVIADAPVAEFDA